MKKSFLLGMVTGAVSLVGVVVLKKRGCCSSHSHRCCSKSKMIVKYLDWKLRLTESQKVKIQLIVDEIMQSHGEKKEAQKALINQFSELFLSDKFESESIQKKAIELTTPCIENAGSVMEQIHLVLSPEQRRELVRLIEKHHGCCGRKGTC